MSGIERLREEMKSRLAAYESRPVDCTTLAGTLAAIHDQKCMVKPEGWSFPHWAAAQKLAARVFLERRKHEF